MKDRNLIKLYILKLIILILCSATYGCKKEFDKSELSKLESNRYLVGAHYYIWYPDNLLGGYIRKNLIPPQEPILGIYNSLDVDVIEQHISWASQYGIDFFTLDYWPSKKEHNERFFESFTKASNINDIKFCVFYETWDLNFRAHQGTTVFREHVVEQFLDDVKHFSTTYFQHPSYLKVNGRPVLYLYLTRTYSGDYERAIEQARQIVRSAGMELFLIGDEIFWEVTEVRTGPRRYPPIARVPQVERVRLFDAITAYNLYMQRKSHHGYGKDSQFISDMVKLLSTYRDLDDGRVPVAPVVMPGYNDRAVRPKKMGHVVPRQWSAGEEEGGFLDNSFKEVGFPFVDDRLKMIFITTWNEWNEDTAIEPLKYSPSTSLDTSEQGDFYTSGYSYSGYEKKYLEVVQKNVIAIAGRAIDTNGNPVQGVNIIAWKSGKPVYF
jgi:glycoprotein endo-alpha-1,2-mannosidase